MGVGIDKSGTGFSLGIILFTSTLVCGCGGGSSGGNGNPVPLDTSGSGIGAGQHLTIKTLDNPINQSKLSGVYVTMYQSDNIHVAQTVTTGSDGTATLSPGLFNSNSSNVAVTVAYEDPNTHKRSIDTFYALQPGSYTMYLGSDSCQSVGNIKVNVNTASYSASTVLLSPYGTGAPDAANTGNITNNAATLSKVNVCSTSLQSDGTYLPLVLAYDNNNGLVGYGYMQNQKFATGDEYGITLDLTPDTLNWSSNDPISNINFFAFRQNVLYLGLGSWNTGSSSSDVKGSFPVAGQFPADAYGYSAYTSVANDNNKISVRRLVNLSDTAKFSFTANQFSDFTYDSAAGTFSWTLDGSGNKDVITISVPLVASTSTSWNIYIDPSVSNLTIPMPPSQLSSWFPNGISLDLKNTTIQERDVAGINGYAAFINNLGTTSTFNLLSYTGMDEVTRHLSISTTPTNGNTSNDTSGGSTSAYGEVTVGGNGAFAFGNTTLSPTSAGSAPNGAGLFWNATDSTTINVQLSQDGSKVIGVTLITPGNQWSIGNGGVLPLANVSVNDTSVTFNNLALSSTQVGNSSSTDITLTGTLNR